MSLSPTRLDVPVAGGTLAAFWMNGGAGTGSPVLSIHGITSSSRTWVAVARALESTAAEGGREVSLLAVDLRGRGASHRLPPPYGLGTHAEDMLAVLEHCGIERALVLGHSLGAYIAARLAAEHPDRVRAVVLVDGGLRIPGTEAVEPQAFLDAFLGPALARLRMRFESPEQYRDWWRSHPAIRAGDVDAADLAAYAAHDLTGEQPELRPAVSEDAVRADAADLFGAEEDGRRLTMPATLLCAPRGLLDDPHPMQPLPQGREWAGGAPGLRSVSQVADVNHYTIVLGQRGAHAVAAAVRAAASA
jgi:pimeloyl-ACP methyl ester carboxylesterase